MSIIDSQYKVEKTVSADFAAGSKPDWLVESASGGGTVNYASTNGGRAALVTGTSAVDDLARLKTNPISVDVFDAVMLRATIEHDAGGAEAGNAVSAVLFRDSDESDLVSHKLNNDVSSRQNTLEVEGNGNLHRVDTRAAISTEPLTTELLWDTVDNRVLHRYQNTFARETVIPSDTVPDSSLDYQGDIIVLTKDTATNRRLWIYELELVYLSKLS